MNALVESRHSSSGLHLPAFLMHFGQGYDAHPFWPFVSGNSWSTNTYWTSTNVTCNITQSPINVQYDAKAAKPLRYCKIHFTSFQSCSWDFQTPAITLTAYKIHGLLQTMFIWDSQMHLQMACKIFTPFHLCVQCKCDCNLK